MHLARVLSGSALLLSLGASAAGINATGIANTCNNCHGLEGVSAGGAMPTISGQPAAYLKMVLQQFHSGERYNTAMGRLLRGYTDAELDALAEYFARQPWRSARESHPTELLVEGRRIYEGRCQGCHGVRGELAHDAMPRIGGQRSKFIRLELQKYLDSGLKMPGEVMRYAVGGMTAREVQAVSAYLSNLE